MTPAPDEPPAERPREVEEHESKREKRTLEEVTERYLALLRAEKERRAAGTDTDDAPKG